jgi:hypothetical protein
LQQALPSTRVIRFHADRIGALCVGPSTSLR